MATDETTHIPEEIILTRARTLIDRAAERMRDEEYRGGFLCVLSREKGRTTPLLHARVGDVPESVKIAEYYTLSQSRARLLQDHLPLSESTGKIHADDAESLLGAAIAGRSLVYAFAGFPEETCLGLMLALAFQVNDLASIDLERIAASYDPALPDAVRAFLELEHHTTM